MVTNCRAHLHTPTVKWINVSRELCHFIYQQTFPYRPSLAALEVGARELSPVLGSFKQDWVLTHKRQQGVLQTSSPASTQTQSMPRDVCQGMPKEPSGACISLAGLTTLHQGKGAREEFTDQLLQNWGCHQVFSAGQGVLVTLGSGKVLVATTAFFSSGHVIASRLVRAEQRAAPLLNASLWLCYSPGWVWSSQVAFCDGEPSTDVLTQLSTRQLLTHSPLPAVV